MQPPERQIDPIEIAGWLVRSVAQQADEPDDVLARVTGTTRAQIAAARIASIQRGALAVVDGGASSARRGGAAGRDRPVFGREAA